MPVDPPPPLAGNLFAPSTIALHSREIFLPSMNIAANYLVEGTDAAPRCVGVNRRAVTVQALHR